LTQIKWLSSSQELADNGKNDERQAQKDCEEDQAAVLEPATAPGLDPIQDPVRHDIENNGDSGEIEQFHAS